MRIPGLSRRLRVRLARMSSPMSPSQPRAFRPPWWAFVGWSPRNAVVHGPTVWHPGAETRSGGSGDDYYGRRPRWWRRRPWVGVIGGATTYRPACRAGARPDIEATQGVTRSPVRLTQHQALSPPQPAASAHGPAPATRVRVVLLPHARTKPTDAPASNRRTEGVQDREQGNSWRQQSL